VWERFGEAAGLGIRSCSIDAERDVKRASDGGNTSNYMCSLNMTCVPGICREMAGFDGNFVCSTSLGCHGHSFVEVPKIRSTEHALWLPREASENVIPRISHIALNSLLKEEGVFHQTCWVVYYGEVVAHKLNCCFEGSRRRSKLGLFLKQGRSIYLMQALRHSALFEIDTVSGGRRYVRKSGRELGPTMTLKC
jgi:hypothetical protein